ncbi:aminotransferase class III-fold pyridoxal phosphate-dependent enzyme [Streptomyces sp. NPDC017966]|uniref:aminotransferase class III-fold pyridoxal phosphate-dependent enzyme n=1 Tax=Streptomyces sp. NPDC017966 TaxID=3365023 RepID=UPI0037BA06F0
MPRVVVRRGHRGGPRTVAQSTYEGRGTGVLPVVPVRARGMTIEGADGRRYLDCLSGAGTLALGHNHPVVLEAIRGIIDSGAPLHAPGPATPVKDAFVTELSRTLPPGLAERARVRFCGPGRDDAVATALRLVRAATGRAGAELADHRTESALGDTASDVRRPAGVIVEPVRDDGGVLPAPDAWLRRLTADRSVPLIVDETLTGVGRTGTFWAVERSGITPDAMVLSAAIGGGLPLAVVVHRDDLALPASRIHTGNQLALAAGTATLAHVRENGLAGHAAALGARMLSRLRTLAGELACVGDVRGRGLLIGVDVVDPEAPSDGTPRDHAAPGLAAAVRRECLRRGLIIGLGGPLASVVRLLPPLTVTEEQAAAVLDRLADALHTAARDHPHGEPRVSGRRHARTG